MSGTSFLTINERRAFVAQVLEMLGEIIERNRVALTESNLEPGSVIAKSFGHEKECETEIEVKFRRDSNIEDIIEFHIIKNGLPVASLQEICSVLEEKRLLP